MHRRDFLTVFPLTAGLAGCINRSGPGNSTTPSYEDRSPSITTTRASPVQETSSVTVQLRSSYRYGINDDGIGVVSPAHDQFAFIDPPVPDEEPAPRSFHLALGDEQFTPVSPVPGFTPWTPGIEAVYSENRKAGSLMFDVPTIETDSAALLYDETKYPLSDEARNRLATAPEFSLTSVSVPESVTPDENIELRITVKNEGDATGTYLAGFRTGGYPKVIDVPLEPGEKGTSAVTYEAYDGSEVMYFDFDYPGGSSDYQVTIESDRTTDTP